MDNKTEKKLKTKPFCYREQHAVIVKVESEKEQIKVFDTLRKLGFNNLKIVSV